MNMQDVLLKKGTVKMKKRLKLICSVATAMCVTSVIGGNSVGANTARQTRAAATAVVLSDVMTTNLTEVSRLMSPTAKKSWVHFAQRMIIDGNQVFLPDFCKVKYTFVGGMDDTSFVMGIYSPFYDTFMLLRVNDAKPVPKIEAFGVASVAVLRGKPEESEFPPSAGTNPGTKYFGVLTAQVRLAGDVFNSKLTSSNSPKWVSSLNAVPDGEIERLRTITMARLGLFSILVDDVRVKGHAVLSSMVVSNGLFADKPYVASDKSTKLSLQTLAKLPVSVRKSFQIVSYFANAEDSNLIFYTPALPTTLIQGHVSGDGKVWLKMFDAHVAGSKFVAGR